MGMGGATATAAAVLLPLVRQAAVGDQTVAWLALGAILGVSYVLGTEKHVHAMQHRHVFVRLSMLITAACSWVAAAVATSMVCVKIYRQTADPLEGFERVIGVLLPAVVRADLIVDWARRMSFSLINVRSWVSACVQFQRIMARTAALRAKPELNVSRDVQTLAMAAHNNRVDVVGSERLIWESDVSLVKAKEIMKHFVHLGRIALYCVIVFVGAVPAGMFWIAYAVYLAVRDGRRKNYLPALLYVLSIPFTPIAVVFSLIASFGLVVSVVSLSVFGTMVQCFLYWAVRYVYCIVRLGLSEEYAGFPILSRTRARREVEFEDVKDGKRNPNEAGTAIARGGDFFPSELEFAQSPWDGRISSEDDSTCDKVDIPSVEEEKEDGSFVPPRSLKGAESLESLELEMDSDSTNDETMERHLSLLQRLGLDRTNNTRRKRRLSSYYALCFMVSFQVESGGKGFCLNAVPELSDSEFMEKVRKFKSFVVDDVAVACKELAKRLRRMTRYRIIHCGGEKDLVDVEQWLRAVVLFLFESPLDTPGALGLLVRQDNVVLDRLSEEGGGVSE